MLIVAEVSFLHHPLRLPVLCRRKADDLLKIKGLKCILDQPARNFRREAMAPVFAKESVRYLDFIPTIDLNMSQSGPAGDFPTILIQNDLDSKSKFFPVFQIYAQELSRLLLGSNPTKCRHDIRIFVYVAENLIVASIQPLRFEMSGLYLLRKGYKGFSLHYPDLRISTFARGTITTAPSLSSALRTRTAAPDSTLTSSDGNPDTVARTPK